MGAGSLAAVTLAATALGQISVGELWRPAAGLRDYFGTGMQSSNDTLVVQSVARVDVYDVTTGEAVWTQVLTLEDFPDWPQLQYLPKPLALHGDWLALGDYTADVDGVDSAGAAYLFHREAGVWTFADRLTSKSPVPWGYFGVSADFDDRTLVVGELDAVDGAGAVHIYERRGGRWDEVHVLEDGNPHSYFGNGVAIDGEWLMVGAPHSTPAGRLVRDFGYVHFYRRESADPLSPWSLTASFKSQWEWHTVSFGSEVALDGDWAVASDPGITGGPGFDTFVFRRTAADNWVKSHVLTSPDKLPWNGQNPNGFGRELSLRVPDLVLGSPYFSGIGGSVGMAYHHRLNDSHWDYLGALLPPQQERIEQLGGSVALAGGRAYVGARYKGSIFGDPWFGFPIVVGASGAAYAFDLSADAQQYCSCPSASPCGNVDSTGGCLNSTGAGGVLTSAGSGSLAADDLRLQAFDLPHYQVAVLAVGTQAVAMPFGDGRLCVWGNVLHAPIEPTWNRGQVDWKPGIAGQVAALGAPIQPGELRHFQVFYRDPAGPCGSGINLTNAVRVDFKP